MSKAALAAGGVLIALAIGLGLPALLTHAEERAAWALERAKQGTAAYDPATSDAHYRASRDAWQKAALPGHLLGAGLVLFTLGTSGRRRSDTGSDSANRAPSAETRVRRGAALVVDLALAGALLSLHLLDAGESALVHAVASAAPWLAALPLVPRLLGATTVGTRLFGGRR